MRMMRTKVFALLAAIMVVSAASIAACTPSSAAGNADGVWCYLPRKGQAETVKVVDNNHILSGQYDGSWTGTFAGSSEEFGAAVIRSSGRRLYIGVVSFDSVDVGGKSGGLEMHVVGVKEDPNSEWEGSWVITDGTGEMEGLRGEGKWWGTGWQSDFEVCGELQYSVDELDFGLD
jgi:hypothetical protein